MTPITILDWLEKHAEAQPEHLALADDRTAISYGELYHHTEAIASGLLYLNVLRCPILVFLPCDALCVTAFWGVTVSGNFYVPMDQTMPKQRLLAIINALQPAAIITDEKSKPLLLGMELAVDVLTIEALLQTPIKSDALLAIRRQMIDTDPLYVLYTSGSTGTPKGAVLCHKNVMRYAEWVSDTFGITNETVFGVQHPFYFSASVLDLYSALRQGATLHVLPRSFFAQPLRLMQYIHDQGINTLYWVPSLLVMLANMGVLEKAPLDTIQKLLFAGEVMPTKQLNCWIKALPPDTLVANLFGPTEVTDICAYYIVDRPFADDEPLPIGKPCRNCDILLLKEDLTLAAGAEEGEICVRGSFLSMGYYRAPEVTAKAFVQNPLNTAYPELIYRTGDLALRNEYGELVYLARKDDQIKHHGCRVELGEIETVASAAEGVDSCACLYDHEAERILLFIEGTADKTSLLPWLRERLPKYMLPGRFFTMDAFPHNANGKIDRKALRRQYEESKK